MENIEGTSNVTTENKAPKAKKERPAPAYKAFIAGLLASVEAMGLGLSHKEQKGYYQFSNPTTKHRLVIAKQGKAVTRIDTTLDVAGQEGTLPLEKENGRIACHVVADPQVVLGFLEAMALGDAPIRAPKRQPKAPKAAAVATEQSA